MSTISLKINISQEANAGYITWTPVPLIITNNDQKTGRLQLSCKEIDGSIPKAVFLADKLAVPSEEIIINFNGDDKQTLFIAGKYQPDKKHNGASPDSKDITLEARWIDESNDVAGSFDIMIRVRKNANVLSDKARNDFTDALAKLNGIKVDNDPTPGPGKGVYVKDFVDSHVAGAYNSEHGDTHFLPWHRLYLLDLERLLQKINPNVSLPYWRFDKPAPQLFQQDFLGETDPLPPGAPFTRGTANKLVKFSIDNQLSKWQINDVSGILREAFFSPLNDPGNVMDEETTLKLGGGDTNLGDAFLGVRATGFTRMEGDPHGLAHTSFNGPINYPPVAPKDPLFFLLHCNIDRLWAKWQNKFDRDNLNEKKSYPYLSATDTTDPWKIINATQWPWDNTTSFPGNLLPPGTRKHNFATSNTGGKNFPNNVPRIKDVIDPFANEDPDHYLDFGYDDVPFKYRNLINTELLVPAMAGISQFRNNMKMTTTMGSDEKEDNLNKLMAIANSEERIDELINVLNTADATAREKEEALHTLEVISVFSPVMPVKTPEFVNALRGLLDEPDTNLRRKVFSDLAVMKDVIVQERLLKELESDKPEGEKVLPTHEIISLLGQDEKVLTRNLLKKIAQNPPDKKSLIEVVRHIPADDDSLGMLMGIMEDNSNPLELRSMIPNIINNVSPISFINSVKKIMEEPEGNDEMTLHLAKGIAGIDDKTIQTEIDETKQFFQKKIENSPDAIKHAALRILFSDDK
jgi:tyrosinase